MDSFNTAFSVGSIALTWNSIMLALGILVAVVVSGIVVKKRGVYKDLALDACIIGIPAGLIGGRLFSAISGKIPFSAFVDLSRSGLNLPGALLFVGIGVAVYARIRKLSLAEVFDTLAPGAFFGLAVGRWSDFFLCDGLGPVVQADSAKFFPLATFTPQYFTDHSTVAYAVFFADFLVCLALGITALLLHKKKTGTASRLTIILYLFAEFILEWLRDGASRQIVFGDVRFNQIPLIFMLGFFVGLSLYRAKHAPAFLETPANAPDEPQPPVEADNAEPDETAEEPENAPDEVQLPADADDDAPDKAGDTPDGGEGDSQ